MQCSEAATAMARTFCRSLAFVFAAFLFACAPKQDDLRYRDAQAAFDRGDWKTAEAKIDDALRAAGDRDSDAVWSLRVMRGDVLVGVGRADEAIQFLTGLRLPARLAHDALEVRRLFALSTAQYRRDRFDDARRSLGAAEALVNEFQPKLRTELLFRKGNLEVNAHRWSEADAFLRQAISSARATGDSKYEGRAWASQARMLGQQERFDEAIAASDRALELANAAQDDSTALKIQQNLGWLLVEIGDFERASELLRSIDAANVRFGREADRIPILLQLGNIELAQQQYDRARPFYTEALGLAQKLKHPSVSACLLNLALVELERSQYAAARRYADDAIEIKQRQNEPERVRWLLLTKARIAERTGNAHDAEKLYRAVLSEATSKSLRWTAGAYLAEFHARKGRLAEAEKQFRVALDTADSAREDLKAEELKLSFPAVVAEFYDSYIDFLADRGRIADAFQVAESRRARTLAEGLGIRKTPESIDPRRVARSSRATVLAYWLGQKRSYLWAATPSQLRLFRLPAAPTIASEIDAYQKELLGSRGSLEASQSRGLQLYDMLVAPAKDLIPPNGNVIVIPDGRISAFNLETLVVSTPSPHYWIEDVTMTTAPSLVVMNGAREQDKPNLLLIGNPRQATGSFPDLPWASLEMTRVRSHFTEAAMLEGERATPRAYVAAMPERYGYVHFVAHGIANRVRPLDSAVVLARDRDGYKLYARDIIRHPLNAGLVTISSCHGAGRRAYASEGLVGLSWAFLRAGAHRVVAALWEVSDSATPELMDSMYAGIRAGEDPATALRNAKLKLLRSKGVYRRPLYWAPFVLYSGA